jgi:hypothetical protein
MLPRLSHRSKIDGRRFEIVDASDGSSNAALNVLQTASSTETKR